MEGKLPLHRLMTVTEQKISALLVHDREEPFEALRLVLENQGIKTYRARNRADLSRLLSQPNPPLLVFTDTDLPDATWEEVLAMAAGAGGPLRVIVVSRVVNLRLYLKVLESGAFDFIVPPFLASDLAHIVRCATWGGTGQSNSPQRHNATL
jgi:DNA-binding NtrC family response regulator